MSLFSDGRQRFLLYSSFAFSRSAALLEYLRLFLTLAEWDLIKVVTMDRKQAVLISGASTGIGKHCALHLAEAGYRVFAGVRCPEAGEELVRAAPSGIEPLLLDVTDAENIRRLADNLRSENLYALINNAGTALLGPLEFLPLDKIRQQFEVNLFGHIAVTQALLHLLRKSQGRIVNIGSIAGLVGFSFAGAYAGTKFAMEAFSDSLRRELKPWKIDVAIIEPGNIKTPIWEKSSKMTLSTAADFPPAAMDYYGHAMIRSRPNFDRMGEPSDVADAVVKVLRAKRPKARYIVGRDARLYSLCRRLLPDSLLDRIISCREAARAEEKATVVNANYGHRVI